MKISNICTGEINELYLKSKVIVASSIVINF